MGNMHADRIRHLCPLCGGVSGADAADCRRHPHLIRPDMAEKITLAAGTVRIAGCCCWQAQRLASVAGRFTSPMTRQYQIPNIYDIWRDGEEHCLCRSPLGIKDKPLGFPSDLLDEGLRDDDYLASA